MGPIQRTRCAASLSLSIIIYEKKDPTFLRTFAADLRAAHYAQSQPSPRQQSALSSAQQLVRNAQRSIIDPVLASLDLSSDSSDEEQLAPDPAREKGEQLRHIRLRDKGGLTLRASGVHICRDIGDENADVDIASTDDALMSLPLAVSSKSPRYTTRSRRQPPTRTPATTAKTDRCAAFMRPPAAKKEKPKSETYKQAWSVSEQHLLERLLSELPNGEKNRYEKAVCSCTPRVKVLNMFTYCRWSKISKAMGGRRTPRQVASRVQKYFEKLKLFGVNVERA